MTVQDFHLARFREYQAKGLDAYRLGQWKDARFQLLKAAEHLFKLARETEAGGLRDQRIKNAHKLKEMAQKIDPEAPPLRDPAGDGADGSGPGPAAPAGKGKGKGPGQGAGRAGGGRVRAGEREGEGEGRKFRAVERPQVCFADVAGLEDVKEQIKLKLLYPFQHPEAARRYGIESGGGILLFGPPGTGKTLIARAVAGEIHAAFFTVKPSEIMSKWVGDSEGNIALLFRTARAEAVSVIFLDEIEALLPARREDKQGSVMTRVVPQILAELDGFDTAGKNPVLFIGATNEPWNLDPAILRPGRFDEKIYVGLPDLPARRQMLEMDLAGRPTEQDLDLDELAARLEGMSGADIRNLCRKAAADAFLEAIETERDARIGRDDLERVLADTRPSVRPQDLARFREYALQQT